MTQSWRKCQSFFYWEPAVCAQEGALAWSQSGHGSLAPSPAALLLGPEASQVGVLGTEGGDQRSLKEISPYNILLLFSLISLVYIRLLWSFAYSQLGSYYCLINWETSRHYLCLGPVRIGATDNVDEAQTQTCTHGSFSLGQCGKLLFFPCFIFSTMI